MKKFIWLFITIVIASSCVDDYTEFNPPSRKDAPTIRLTSSGSSQVLETQNINAWQKNYFSYVGYDQPVQFTVSVIDAPGLIGSVSVEGSVPEFGTITIDESSVASIIGKEQGEFRFTFTPNAALEDQDELDRPLNIVITVSDTQKDNKGKENPKVTTLTIPTILAGPCLSSGIQEGYYLVIDASGNLDGGTPFTLEDLIADGQSEQVVSVTRDRPGVYTFNEMTAGVWPIYYSGRATPELQVDLCGTTITGRAGGTVAGAGTVAARTFTIDGLVNGDGTITINWSYVRDDGSTPANPASGSYTLKHFTAL